MDKPNTATRPLDAYEDNVTLSKICGQTTAANYLIKLTEQFQYDQYASKTKTSKLPNILLVGGASRRLLSKAFANDLAFFGYEEYYAHTLGMGMDYSGTLFLPSQEETVYHLRISSEPLMTSFITQMSYLMRHGYILIDGKVILRLYNKVIIWSSDILENVPPLILENIDHIIEVSSTFKIEELVSIIKNRLKFMNLGFDDPIVPMQIADRGRTVTNIIQILKIVYMLVRSDCRSYVTLKDAQDAIKLFNKPSVPTPTSRTRKLS